MDEGFSRLNPLVLKWLKRWRQDPVRFAWDIFRFKPTPQQKLVMEDAAKLVRCKLKAHFGHPMEEWEVEYSKKRGISVRSGKGTGKNAVMAVLVFWFLLCFHKPKVPCTAPTKAQIEANLWSELSKWLTSSDPETGKKVCPLRSVFQLRGTKLHLKNDVYDGKEWFALARTAQKTGSDEEQARTLQGFHADHMMILVDEASGVSEPVFRPFDTTLTGRNNWIFLSFNPNSRRGFAARTHLDPKERRHWLLHHWNAEECPIVSEDHVEYMREKYGTDTDMYRVNVLGEFPEQESGSVIPWEFAYDAVTREILEEQVSGFPTHMGIDPGAGGDPTVVALRQGPKVIGFWETGEIRTDDVVEWVMGLIANWQPDKIFIDKAGVGHGVYSYIKRYVGHNVYGLNVGKSAFTKNRFAGLRDELWWRMREAFEEGMDIPEDEELIVELTAPRYDRPGGKIKVDDKKALRSRIGRSTNRADALIHTFYHDAKYDLQKDSQIKEDLKKGRRHRYLFDDDDDDFGPLGWMSV